MELMAAIQALESLKAPCAVTLHADSQYVIEGMSRWRLNWDRTGWRTADRKPVKNADLWTRLIKAADRHKVTWKWVRGHGDNVMNIRVDQLVGLAREEAVKG
jgi:ribonuclease HI